MQHKSDWSDITCSLFNSGSLVGQLPLPAVGESRAVKRVGEGGDTGWASVYLSCTVFVWVLESFVAAKQVTKLLSVCYLPPAKHKEAPEVKAKRVIQMRRPLSLFVNVHICNAWTVSVCQQQLSKVQTNAAIAR